MRKTRILLAKPGLDGHLRGINVLAKGLREAGMEVVYLGVDLTPIEISQAAIEEFVDIIGLSIHAGGPVTLVSKVQEGLVNGGMPDIPIIVGGIISKKERQKLLEMNVKGIFGPGSRLKSIIQCINESSKT
jgi:methylmalonyl-CoA mutase C-terminal domain/subunit